MPSSVDSQWCWNCRCFEIADRTLPGKKSESKRMAVPRKFSAKSQKVHICFPSEGNRSPWDESGRLGSAASTFPHRQCEAYGFITKLLEYRFESQAEPCDRNHPMPQNVNRVAETGWRGDVEGLPIISTTHPSTAPPPLLAS